MANENIINIPTFQNEIHDTVKEAPEWIKNNAKWLADNLITEEEFVEGIQFMVKQKIIKVT